MGFRDPGTIELQKDGEKTYFVSESTVMAERNLIFRLAIKREEEENQKPRSQEKNKLSSKQ